MFQKPPALRAERQAKRRARETSERKAKQAAKRRDHSKCRWPRCRCYFDKAPLEAAHWRGKGMGGDHGLRSHPENLITLCRDRHRGYVSLHSGDLRITPLTAKRMDGPCEFHRLERAHGSFASADDGTWVLEGRETAIGRLE